MGGHWPTTILVVWDALQSNDKKIYSKLYEKDSKISKRLNSLSWDLLTEYRFSKSITRVLGFAWWWLKLCSWLAEVEAKRRSCWCGVDKNMSDAEWNLGGGEGYLSQRFFGWVEWVRTGASHWLLCYKSLSIIKVDCSNSHTRTTSLGVKGSIESC